ncbi:hypothetical protein EVAR_91248_1 [Eumeta japonica]|uniref:Uncharacterized protein n=1 Tax=Eumeta variegata TaxID=151549 RepID=A0A4C1ZZ66_EUMVA|nr:hypothetical protein EVAR_91248_1 [Eumeta japonica]
MSVNLSKTIPSFAAQPASLRAGPAVRGHCDKRSLQPDARRTTIRTRLCGAKLDENHCISHTYTKSINLKPVFKSAYCDGPYKTRVKDETKEPERPEP